VLRSSTARSLVGPVARRAPGLAVRLVLLIGLLVRRRAAAEVVALRLAETARRTTSALRVRRAVEPLLARPPQRANAVADLAALLVALDDPDAAVDLCRAVLDRRTEPGDRAHLHAQLGRAHQRAGSPERGAEALAEAVGAEAEQRPDWRLWWAQALVAAGDLDAVATVLDADAVAALEPDQQARAVKVLVGAGAWGRVREVVSAGLVAPQAATRAAKLAARAGRGDDARAMARALHEPRWRRTALLDVARTHLVREEHDRASELAREAVALDERATDALTVLVRTYQHGGNLAEARATVQRVADRYPQDPAIVAWAVETSYSLRSWDEAAALVERLRPLDPDAARVAGARIALRAGALDAPAQVERLAAERPNDPEVARVVAELAQRSARPEEAYAAFRRAATGLPDDANVRLACARLAVQLGHDEEALEDLDWLLEQRPRDPRLRRLQVRAEARLGRRTGLDDLTDVGADPIDELLVFELVTGLVDGGRDAEAAAALERALLIRARRDDDDRAEVPA
jgi:tetratricopeptide (TPR) repeat protein